MGVAIRKARQSDRETVTQLLYDAFLNDPVSVWVFPDERHRRRAHRALMGVFLDLALGEGHVEMTDDGTAAALWLSVLAGSQDDEQGPALIREAVDPGNERIETVGRLTGAFHPMDRTHEYLQLVAVAPDRQGEGLGGALIGAMLERCDREGLPAYLEASTPRSRGLYERLGYAFMGRTVDLPDGPRMWPMWREPRRAGRR